MTFQYFYDVYIYSIFTNIYKINFLPLLIINVILFLIKLLAYNLFNDLIVYIIITFIYWSYYFLINPALLLIWNINYAFINKQKTFFKNILLILISTIIGYILPLINDKIITGTFIDNIYGLGPIIILFFFVIFIILIIGSVIQIQLNKDKKL